MNRINENSFLKLAPLILLTIHLLTIILLGSCRRSLKEHEYQLHLVCNPIELDLEFYIPLKISYINGRFFVADFHGERMIREIDRNTFSWMGDFGVRGQGPVEFIGPILTWEVGEKLFVFDRRGFSVGYYDTAIPDTLSTYKYRELFHVDNTINTIVSLGQNFYLAAGFFEQGRYALLDRLGQEIHYFAAYPEFKEGEDRIPYDAKAMFHQVGFAANYDNTRIAALSRHVLDIIDLSNDKPVILSRVKLADYAYDFQSGNIVKTDLKNGFVRGARSVTGCRQFVYVLFNPNIKGDERGKYNLEIWVFDWDGQLIGKNKVFCDLDLIKAVDCSKLFGITMDLDFVFLEF